MKWSFALSAALLLAGMMQLSAAPLKMYRAFPFRPDRRPGATFSYNEKGYSVKLDKKTGMYGKWSAVYNLPEDVTACKLQVRHNAGKDAVKKELVVVWVSWQDENGRNMEAAYMEPVSADTFSRTLRRPLGAESIRISMGIRHFYKEVTFTDIVCEPVELEPRNARIVVAKGTGGFSAKLMDAVCQKLEKAGEKPDLLVFPEAEIPCGGKLAGAQPIPGAATEQAGVWAKKLKTNMVIGLLEVKDGRYYNSAAVIDRTGKVAGVYRKTHLSINEYESGLRWGSEMPVFDLDFGKVGVLLGGDILYPEASRLLRLRGAEVIALAGTDIAKKYYDNVWRTRAGQNGMVLAAAMGGSEATPSRIVMPDTTVPDGTYEGQTYAAATVDLTNLPFYVAYLSVSPGAGETRSFFIRERQPELYRILSGDSE